MGKIHGVDNFWRVTRVPVRRPILSGEESRVRKGGISITPVRARRDG
jgi:hypothetical protein